MEKRFICATRAYCDFTHRVAAPYLRRTFDLRFAPEFADLKICGLGFYRLWINGQEITKGCFAPYISNPDDRMYFDAYDLTPYLRQGENVFCITGGGSFCRMRLELLVAAGVSCAGAFPEGTVVVPP